MQPAWSTATFLFWCFSVYGVTFAVKDSKLLQKPRVFLKRWEFLAALLGCPFCVGFWAGLLVTSTMLPPCVESIPTAILGGFAGASWSYVADLLALKLEGSED